jgi:hypothetical protein
MKIKEPPWNCIKCSQLNSGWAAECGHCGWKRKADTYRNDPRPSEVIAKDGWPEE